MADIAELVTSDALRELYGLPKEVGQSIESEAVPGPTSKVLPFKPGEASGGAFLAKLGARIFERARERAVYKDKQAKLALDQQYRQAQIDRLTQLATPKPTYSVKVGERTFEGLDPNQAVSAELKMQGDPERIIDKDPETGKPLGAKMTMSEWIRIRGQNKAGERASAARTLSEKLAGQRVATQQGGQQDLAASRALAQIDQEPVVASYNRARAAAADSLMRKGQKNPSQSSIDKLAKKMWPDVEMAQRGRVTARRDSLLRVLEGSALNRQQVDPQTLQMLEGLKQIMEAPE